MSSLAKQPDMRMTPHVCTVSVAMFHVYYDQDFARLIGNAKVASGPFELRPITRIVTIALLPRGILEGHVTPLSTCNTPRITVLCMSAASLSTPLPSADAALGHLSNCIGAVHTNATRTRCALLRLTRVRGAAKRPSGAFAPGVRPVVTDCVDANRNMKSIRPDEWSSFGRYLYRWDSTAVHVH